MTNSKDVVFVEYKTCPYCKERFKAHHRLKERQKTCGKPSCKKLHRKKYQITYRKLNKESELEYRIKRKQKLSKDYWKTWRFKHPKYVLRNRMQSKLRKKLLKLGLQRKLDIVQVAESKEYFVKFGEFAMRHRCLVMSSFGKAG